MDCENSVPRIIVLVGPKQAGKTTVATELLTEHGCLRFRFADPLKNMLATIGVPRDCLDGARKEEPLDLLCGKTGRHAMQTLGTLWRDSIDRQLWARITVREIEQVVAERRVKGLDTTAVIDDARFPHEISLLQAHFDNVEVWRVYDHTKRYPLLRMALSRNILTGWAMRLLRLDIHISECWWPAIQCKHFLSNSGTLPELYRSVARVVRMNAWSPTCKPSRLRVSERPTSEKGASA